MTEMQTALESGLKVISDNQVITFTKYARTVLPLDGFVFWLLTTDTVDVAGSLHYSSSQEMDESDTTTINQVVFTTTYEVTALNATGGNELWLGIINGVKFAFNNTGMRSENAGLWHYSGESVKPTFLTQFIGDIDAFDALNIVDGTSMAAWLELSDTIPVYPSHLVPANQAPPYIAINIMEQKSVNNSPWQDARNESNYLLVDEKVRVTLHGMRHGAAHDFIETAQLYSERTGNLAICRNDHWTAKPMRRTHSPVGAINQEKEAVFFIQYLQCRIRDVADRLILECKVNFLHDAPTPTESLHYSSTEQLDTDSPLHYSSVTDKANE